MKNIPLLLKHSVILMGIMLVSLTTLVWYCVNHFIDYSEHEIAQASLAETKASLEHTEEVMGTIVDHSARLATSEIFEKIRDIRSIADLNRNMAHLANATMIQKELTSFNKVNSGITSSFVYLEGTDYMISTDKGITSLLNYESINWMNAALETREGIQGIWFNRWDQIDDRSVFSFVLPIQSLSGAIKGNIVVNVLESEFSQYLASKQKGFNEYLLINENGYIVSHPNQEMLFKHIKHNSFFSDVINHFSPDGYTYRVKDGQRQLVTWSHSQYSGWLNVNVYEVSKQMDTIYRMQKSIFLVAFFMILAALLLSLIVTKKLSGPINKLVAKAKSRVYNSTDMKNELLLLEAAIQKRQDEEEELQRLLHDREKETKDIVLQQLIRGEVTDQACNLFNKKHILIAIIVLDAHRKYLLRNSPEKRNRHRSTWIKEIDQLAIEHLSIECIEDGDGRYVLIINSAAAGLSSFDQLTATFTAIHTRATKIFQQSVTISVSEYTSSIHDINKLYVIALEGVKQRMLQGHGNIIYCSAIKTDEQQNYYPAANEKKILSFIDQRNFENIKQELTSILNEIRQQSNMSPDSVLFIGHQLVGATIKHLREKNVNVQRLLSSKKNIYTELAVSETLADIENALASFYEDITNHLLERTEGDGSQYGERMLQYLNSSYQKDIVFEEMAEEIGISYSYMRKVFMDITGISLMDYVHSLRIKHAKDLLASTHLTIAQIAEEVGYNNIRSFNRFFQKLEHVTPSAYRSEQYKVMNTSRQVLIK